MMIGLWGSDGQSVSKGEFWDLKVPFANRKTGWEYHIRPYQQPHPSRIAVAGTSPHSRSLAWGAGRGFIPMSFFDLNAAVLRTHWEVISRGLRKSAGSLGAGTGAWRGWSMWQKMTRCGADPCLRKAQCRWALPGVDFRRVMALFGGLSAIKHESISPRMKKVDTKAYMLEHVWMVGSPETVADKLRRIFIPEVGGFRDAAGRAFRYELPYLNASMRSLAFVTQAGSSRA